MFPLYDFNIVCAAIATVSAAVGYRYTRGRPERRAGSLSRCVCSNGNEAAAHSIPPLGPLSCACRITGCHGGATATLANCHPTCQSSLRPTPLTAHPSTVPPQNPYVDDPALRSCLGLTHQCPAIFQISDVTEAGTLKRKHREEDANVERFLCSSGLPILTAQTEFRTLACESWLGMYKLMLHFVSFFSTKGSLHRANHPGNGAGHLPARRMWP